MAEQRDSFTPTWTGQEVSDRRLKTIVFSAAEPSLTAIYELGNDDGAGNFIPSSRDEHYRLNVGDLALVLRNFYEAVHTYVINNVPPM